MTALLQISKYCFVPSSSSFPPLPFPPLPNLRLCKLYSLNFCIGLQILIGLSGVDVSAYISPLE